MGGFLRRLGVAVVLVAGGVVWRLGVARVGGGWGLGGGGRFLLLWLWLLLLLCFLLLLMGRGILLRRLLCSRRSRRLETSNGIGGLAMGTDSRVILRLLLPCRLLLFRHRRLLLCRRLLLFRRLRRLRLRRLRRLGMGRLGSLLSLGIRRLLNRASLPSLLSRLWGSSQVLHSMRLRI